TGTVMSRMTMPIVRVAPRRMLCATASGRYPSSTIACSTRARMASLTDLWPLSTREAVPSETPAACATSRIVGRTISDGTGHLAEGSEVMETFHQLLVSCGAREISKDAGDARELVPSYPPPLRGLSDAGPSSSKGMSDAAVVRPSRPAS